MFELYFKMFFAGIAGIILHSVIKLRGIKQRNPEKSYNELLKMFIQLELLSVATSAFIVIVFIFISDEYLSLKPADDNPLLAGTLMFKLVKFIKSIFIVVGFFAQNLAYAFLGKIEKKIQDMAKAAGVDSIE
jgi:hypothetical protein